jgi:hypothetical protein
MKIKFPLRYLTALAVLLASLGSSVSCVTSYDAYGRPLQTVDPALAVAGIAAAGLIGYAAANNNNSNYSGYGGGYYNAPPCQGGNTYGGYSRGGYYHSGSYQSGSRSGY